jgi:hypothetical protein
MSSLPFDNFLVDQLSLVVSIIPIRISPEFLNIFGRETSDCHSGCLGAGPGTTLSNKVDENKNTERNTVNRFASLGFPLKFPLTIVKNHKLIKKSQKTKTNFLCGIASPSNQKKSIFSDLTRSSKIFNVPQNSHTYLNLSL